MKRRDMIVILLAMVVIAAFALLVNHYAGANEWLQTCHVGSPTLGGKSVDKMLDRDSACHCEGDDSACTDEGSKRANQEVPDSELTGTSGNRLYPKGHGFLCRINLRHYSLEVSYRNEHKADSDNQSDREHDVSHFVATLLFQDSHSPKLKRECLVADLLYRVSDMNPHHKASLNSPLIHADARKIL